jgi:hypothetical protein
MNINQRIITRGMGTRQLLCTRGYGRVGARIREVIRLCGCLAQQIWLKSPWSKTAST